MQKIKQGFTLFELLVSISIIAIITALVTVSYSNAQRKARDTKIMEDLNMIQKAAEQYYATHSFAYPGIGQWSVGSRWTDVSGAQVILNYLPADPKGASYWSANITGTTYCLCSSNPLEASNGNATDRACGGMGNSSGTYYCIQNQQ